MSTSGRLEHDIQSKKRRSATEWYLSKRSFLLSLLLVLSMIIVGTVPIVEPTEAQALGVDLQDAIFEDASEFDVEYVAGNARPLVIENQATGETYERPVQGQGSVSVLVEEIGGINPGDTITATLYVNRSKNEIIDTDTVRVTGFLGRFRRTTYTATQGELLDIGAIISNPGDVSDTQTISLEVVTQTIVAITSQSVDSKEVTLASGDSQPIRLIWNTTGWGIGSYTVWLTDNDDVLDAATVNITDRRPANVAISITSITSPVTEGDPLRVTATVTNTGDEPATQDITLDIDGKVTDSVGVTLDGGESRDVTLFWQTTTGDAGDHTATVSSKNDFVTRDVRVNEPATFRVSIESSPPSVIEGETANVTATITNTGDEPATQDITLDIDGRVTDSTTVTLEGGESQSVTLTWETAVGDGGTEHTATVSSTDSRDTSSITVVEAANFAVSITEIPTAVTAGESVDISATITNTGEETATQRVVLEIGDEVTDTTEVTLEGGKSQSVTFTWLTETDDGGKQHLVVVSSADQSDAEELTVERPGEFTVSIQSVTASITEGDPLEVRVSVTNTGSERATQAIRLEIDGSVERVTEVSLNGGESRVLTLTWRTRVGDADDRRIVTVASADDRDSSEITVEAKITPQVTETNELPLLSVISERVSQIDPARAGVVGGVMILGLVVVVFRNELLAVGQELIAAIRSRFTNNNNNNNNEEENGLPTAKITILPETPTPFRPILIDGSMSYDPDPDDRIVDYAWSVDDHEPSTPRFIYGFIETGDHDITLEVRNNRGESGTKTETITVEEQAGELELASVHPDAPGTDHTALFEEYIVFKNTGTELIALDGWTVHDAAEEEGRVTKGRHTYEFDDGRELPPGGTLTLHTGKQPDDWTGTQDDPQEQHCCWGKNWPVWNNDEDIIIVQDTERTPVLARRYEKQSGSDEYVIEPVENESLLDWFEDIVIDEFEKTEPGKKLTAVSRLIDYIKGAMFLGGPRRFLVSWLAIGGVSIVTPVTGLSLIAVGMLCIGVLWSIVHRLRA